MGYRDYSKTWNFKTLNKLLDRGVFGISKFISCYEYKTENLPELKIAFDLNGKEKEFKASNHEDLARQICSDKEMALFISSKGTGYSQYFDERLKEDKDVQIAAFSNKTLVSLRNMPWKAREDRDVILAALNNNGFDFQYISPELRDNPEFILAAIQSKSYDFNDFPQWITKDKNIMTQIVAKDGNLLKHASPELKDDIDVVKAATLNTWGALKHASIPIQEDVTVLCDMMPDFDNYNLELTNDPDKVQFIAWVSPELEQSLIKQTEYSEMKNIGVYELGIECDLETREMGITYVLFAEYENASTRDFGDNLPFYSERSGIQLEIDNVTKDIAFNHVNVKAFEVQLEHDANNQER